MLGRAPTPELGLALSKSTLAALLRRGGRQRHVDALVEAIQDALHSEHLAAPPLASKAYGAVVSTAAAVLAEMNRQLERLEEELSRAFDAHPDVEILRSLPGTGHRPRRSADGEFGDDPNRYAS